MKILNLPQIIIILSILLITSVIHGRFVLKLFKIDSYLPSNFAVNIPIYGAAGLSLITLVLNIFGVFTVGEISLIGFLIVTIITVIFLWYSGDFSSISLKIKEITRLSYSFLISRLIPLTLVIITLYHFSQVIEIMRWPYISDICYTHAPLTSLILYLGKTPIFNLAPFVNSSWYYPPFFHTVAANITSWFQILPAQSVFLVGGLLIIFITLLMYSVTYLLTRSVPFSLIVYFSCFIYEGKYLLTWITGFFYVGTYPFLTGFLIIIFSISALILAEYVPSSKPKKPEKFLAVLIFSFLVILLVYPNFTILQTLIILLLLVKHYDEFLIFFQKNYILIVSLFFLLVLGILLVFQIKAYPYNYISQFISQPGFLGQITSLFGVNYIFYPGFFTGFIEFIGKHGFQFINVNSVAMWPAFFISMIFVYKKKYVLISLFFIIIFCVSISTISEITPSIVNIILPSRAIMIPWTLSWFMLSLGLSEVLGLKRIKILDFPFKNSNFLVYTLIFFLIVFPLFSTCIINEFTNVNANKFGWYAYQTAFPDDFAGLCWIDKNIPPEDLILNDLSFAGMWILSFSFKNVTFNINFDNVKWQRAVELQRVWENPYDGKMVYQLLEKYNVSYVFIPSDPGFRYDPHLGGDKTYIPKPFTPAEYIQIFNSYTFLKVVFQSGSTAIYKVILNGST